MLNALRSRLDDRSAHVGVAGLGYVAYGLMAIGGIFLLVGLWRLVTLRIFRGFFAVVAALLVAYYPVAYGVHWWLPILTRNVVSKAVVLSILLPALRMLWRALEAPPS